MNQSITRIAVNPQQMHRNMTELWRMAKEADYSRPMELVLRPRKRKRSVPQNSRLWAIHSDVAAWLSVNTDQKWSPESVHEVLFKPKFCGLNAYDVNGITINCPKSSTDLTVEQMTEAQAAYEAWCYSVGVELD